jgi:hypothetical protein
MRATSRIAGNQVRASVTGDHPYRRCGSAPLKLACRGSMKLRCLNAAVDRVSSIRYWHHRLLHRDKGFATRLKGWFLDRRRRRSVLSDY